MREAMERKPGRAGSGDNLRMSRTQRRRPLGPRTKTLLFFDRHKRRVVVEPAVFLGRKGNIAAKLGKVIGRLGPCSGEGRSNSGHLAEAAAASRLV
jgi:hypothetical protein